MTSNGVLAESGSEMESDYTRAVLRLALTPGVGGVSFRALLERFGSSQAALEAGAAAVAEVPGFGLNRARAFVEGRSAVDVEAELEKAAARQVRIIPYGDAAYPVALTYLPDPPPVLYMRGELLPLDCRAFAIVGSRRSSLYGQQQAERFAAGLAGAGFTIVSGLARGIDICAHQGAMKAGGRTIAVLGNGLSSVYPPEHARQAEEVAAHGAVISEFPMDAEPLAENFPRRNRVISGLSLGVLVVEAGRKSGALITASAAAEQGKDVFAVPGRIDSPFAFGAHQLIQKGAKLVQSLEDILDEYPDLGLSAASQGGGAQQALLLGPRLDPQEEAVLGALDDEPQTADQIAARAGLPAAAVAANLTMLELKRLARSVPGQRFVRGRAAQQ